MLDPRCLFPPSPAEERTGGRTARGLAADQGGQGPRGRAAAGDRPPGRSGPRPGQRSARPPPGRAALRTRHEGIGEPALCLQAASSSRAITASRSSSSSTTLPQSWPCRTPFSSSTSGSGSPLGAQSRSATIRQSVRPTWVTASHHDVRPPRAPPGRARRNRRGARTDDRAAARGARPRRSLRAVAGAVRRLDRRRSGHSPGRARRQRGRQEHPRPRHLGSRGADRGSRHLRREGHHRPARPPHPPAGPHLHPGGAWDLSRVFP